MLQKVTFCTRPLLNPSPFEASLRYNYPTCIFAASTYLPSRPGGLTRPSRVPLRAAGGLFELGTVQDAGLSGVIR